MVDLPTARVRIEQELLDRGVVTSPDEARELLASDDDFRRGVEHRAAVELASKREHDSFFGLDRSDEPLLLRQDPRDVVTEWLDDLDASIRMGWLKQLGDLLASVRADTDGGAR
jgi:hypothetical protein